MASIGFRFESRPTFRDTQGRFARATEALINDKRNEMRGLGRLAKRYWQEEAPKKSGDFARGIGFRSFTSGDTVGFTIHTPQPLGSFIIDGTRPHAIVGNPILAFYWEKVGRMVFTHSVAHPGTKPNPFHERAYQRWRPEADAAIRRISTRWSARL